MKQEQSYCCSPIRHEDLSEDMPLDWESIRKKKISIYNPTIFPQSTHIRSLLNKRKNKFTETAEKFLTLLPNFHCHYLLTRWKVGWAETCNHHALQQLWCCSPDHSGDHWYCSQCLWCCSWTCILDYSLRTPRNCQLHGLCPKLLRWSKCHNCSVLWHW